MTGKQDKSKWWRTVEEKGAAKEPEHERGYFRRGGKHEMRREGKKRKRKEE